MTAYFVLRTPSGPVRFRVNIEARDYEAVLVREDNMSSYGEMDVVRGDMRTLEDRCRELESEISRLDARAQRLCSVVCALAEERHLKAGHRSAFEVCDHAFCSAAREA